NAKSTSVRFARDASRHAGNAARAEPTTADTSAALASGTSPVTCPVAGFVTGAERPSPWRGAPSTQCGTRVLIDAPETGAAPSRRACVERKSRSHLPSAQCQEDSPPTTETHRRLRAFCASSYFLMCELARKHRTRLGW